MGLGEAVMEMKIIMAVAKSLRTSDSNGERHKHATGENEMTIEPNSNSHSQTGVTGNRKQYGIRGRGGDHRK